MRGLRHARGVHRAEFLSRVRVRPEGSYDLRGRAVAGRDRDRVGPVPSDVVDGPMVRRAAHPRTSRHQRHDCHMGTLRRGLAARHLRRRRARRRGSRSRGGGCRAGCHPLLVSSQKCCNGEHGGKTLWSSVMLVVPSSRRPVVPRCSPVRACSPIAANIAPARLRFAVVNAFPHGSRCGAELPISLSHCDRRRARAAGDATAGEASRERGRSPVTGSRSSTARSCAG